MISVIIPTLNEARALPATLRALFAQTGKFETILVDGGSTDGTLRNAKLHPAVRILYGARGRASQMNAGAAEAHGEWLLFLHADTLLPPQALVSIAALGTDAYAGGFRHEFSGNNAVLRLISYINNRRCAKTGVFFGDQAFFIRRRLFQRLGGFPEQGLMEDLRFSRRLVDVCAARQGLPRLMPGTAVTASRKFEKMGVLRSFWRIAVILTCLELKRPLPQGALRFFQDIR